MAFFVRSDFVDASKFIKDGMQIVIYFVIPGLTLALLIILAPIFCCCGCCGQKCTGLHKRVLGVAQHIFCFLEKKGSSFVVFGYKAPICYTYYLLFLVFILCIHCFFTFWDSAFHHSTNAAILSWDSDYRYSYCLDIFGVEDSPGYYPHDYNDTTSHQLDQFGIQCIEIHLLEGAENAAVTFGLSALAVAIITWILLTCSKGNRATKQSRSRMLCLPAVILFQVIGIIVPRSIFYIYTVLITNAANAKREWVFGSRFNTLIPAVTNEESLFAGIAIFDAISLTMLTPWFCFEKMDSADEGITKFNPASCPTSTNLRV